MEAKNNLYKLAVIDAVKNREKIVKSYNFENVERFIFIHLDSVFTAIKMSNHENKRLDDDSRIKIIKSVLKNGEVEGTTILRNKVIKVKGWDLGMTTTFKFLQKHESRFTVTKKGNTKIWR